MRLPSSTSTSDSTAGRQMQLYTTGIRQQREAQTQPNHVRRMRRHRHYTWRCHRSFVLQSVLCQGDTTASCTLAQRTAHTTQAPFDSTHTSQGAWEHPRNPSKAAHGWRGSHQTAACGMPPHPSRQRTPRIKEPSNIASAADTQHVMNLRHSMPLCAMPLLPTSSASSSNLFFEKRKIHTAKHGCILQICPCCCCQHSSSSGTKGLHPSTSQKEQTQEPHHPPLLQQQQQPQAQATSCGCLYRSCC